MTSGELMTRRLLTPLVAALLMAPSLSAQSKPTVEQLLDRMRAYLAEYETQLSSVVADERFEQRVVYTRAYQGGLPKTDDERRRLESEIGFIRLPGGVDWLGFRDVRRINGRDLTRRKLQRGRRAGLQRRCDVAGPRHCGSER